MFARVRRLKSEQDGGQRLYIHQLDDQLKGRRDADGSQHFDASQILPGVSHAVDLLI